MKGYLVYMAFIIIFTVPIFISPFFSWDLDYFETIHSIYQPTCHQLASRSFCYFPVKGTIEDCFPTNDLKPTKAEIIQKDGATGYKFPVCSRDIGIYGFMLLGGIAFWFVKKPDSKIMPPAIWLILALIPIGIDGTGQLLGFWESTNEMRLITGAIAGLSMPFYIVPMLNRWLDKENGSEKTGKKQNRE